jgi:hypothetical protein
MSEWRGPWKCKKCGKSGSDEWRDLVNYRGLHFGPGDETEPSCDGILVPYDRRRDHSAEREAFVAGHVDCAKGVFLNSYGEEWPEEVRSLSEQIAGDEALHRYPDRSKS